MQKNRIPKEPKDESDKGYIFHSALAKRIMYQKEQSLIIAAVTDYLCTTEKFNYERNTVRSEIIVVEEAEVVFEVSAILRTLPSYLFKYEARTRESYVNAKKVIEDLGFNIDESEHEHGARLVWKITIKKAA